MRGNVTLVRAAVVFSILGAAAATVAFAPARHMKTVMGSDHREAPTVDMMPEGDITDVYSFVDPNDSTKVDFIMNVNPFAVPAESGSYSFSPDFLYQFKIDNTGDAIEDEVIQIKFDQAGQSQTASVYVGAPTTTGARNTLLGAAPVASVKFNAAAATGSSGVTVFAGLRDDAFVFDFAQFTRILNGTQDLFRNVPNYTEGSTPPATGFRGRPIRADGTSGVDSFAGFNLTSIAVSVPKTMVRGSGPMINVWATVSQPVPTRHGQNTYLQFERQGQQAVSTIFVPSGAARDAFNFAIPQNDVANYSSLIPDALTTTDNDGTGNTIAGRAATLTSLGLTALPNGAPLLLPATFGNTDKNLLREALLPDVQRLNVDQASATTTSGTLDIGQFGLQNGRPVNFSTIDLPLQILRQLADVQFPSGTGIPGSGPLGTRAALGCTQYPECEDRRVLVVLQGTQFITPDANITQYLDGNDLPLLTTFPYLAAPHPLPGAAGTINFPPQE